jgi:hypothetical protein
MCFGRGCKSCDQTGKMVIDFDPHTRYSPQIASDIGDVIQGDVPDEDLYRNRQFVNLIRQFDAFAVKHAHPYSSKF